MELEPSCNFDSISCGGGSDYADDDDTVRGGDDDGEGCPAEFAHCMVRRPSAPVYEVNNEYPPKCHFQLLSLRPTSAGLCSELIH